MNGQSEEGYRYINLPLPEPGNNNPTHLEEDPDPRLKMIYQGSPILISGTLFSPSQVLQKRATSYTSLPDVGDGMIASNPIQHTPFSYLSDNSVSWPFHAGKELLKSFPQSVEIWLIGNAVGASGFAPSMNTTWDVDDTTIPNNLFYNMIDTVSKAIERHNLTPLAFMWHDGETDAEQGMPYWKLVEKFDRMIEKLREYYPDIPVVLGRIGDKYRGSGVDLAIEGAPSRIANCSFVDVEIGNDIGDEVHFTADAHREMGRWYASALMEIMGG